MCLSGGHEHRNRETNDAWSVIGAWWCILVVLDLVFGGKVGVLSVMNNRF